MDRRCHVPNSARPVHVGSRRLAIIQLLVSYAIIRFSHIFEQHLRINARILLEDPNSIVEAKANDETRNGVVSIQALIVDLSSVVKPLESGFLKAEVLLRQRCAQ